MNRVTDTTLKLQQQNSEIESLKKSLSNFQETTVTYLKMLLETKKSQIQVPKIVSVHIFFIFQFSLKTSSVVNVNSKGTFQFFRMSFRVF